MNKVPAYHGELLRIYPHKVEIGVDDVGSGDSLQQLVDRVALRRLVIGERHDQVRVGTTDLKTEIRLVLPFHLRR